MPRVVTLIDGMRRALPLYAAVTPELAAVARAQNPGCDLPRQWRITEVNYAGDEGGIMCRLDDGGDGSLGDFVVSITHLRFARKSPLSREIEAYQKHRVKWLRRLGVAGLPLLEDHGP